MLFEEMWVIEFQMLDRAQLSKIYEKAKQMLFDKLLIKTVEILSEKYFLNLSEEFNFGKLLKLLFEIFLITTHKLNLRLWEVID